MDQINVLFALLAGLGASAVTGLLKRADVALGVQVLAKLGNLMPVLVTLLTVLLPKLTTLLHLTSIPDATALANAPLATIIAIAAREAVIKLQPKASP